MVKAELVQALAQRYPDLPPEVAESVVNLAIEAMADALANGEDIEIRGFGSFRIKRQNPKWARNPRSGELVFKSARNSIHFKAGKEILQKIRSAEDH